MTEDDSGPVHLVEDAETGDRFLVYASDKGLRLDIRYEGETLWMTQAQIAQLFGVERSVVTKHVGNIYEEGELEAGPTSARIAQVRQEGSRQVERQIEHYNLDVVISVGYRVSSAQATLFRRWATGILVQFARRGFVIDAPRLKQPDSADRLAELREIIRDIRSDEANIYRELRRICSLCQDYDGSSAAAQAFYQHTQAKLVFAVTAHTPSEFIASRGDPAAADMGLTAWSGEAVRKTDVTVSKNYLAAGEIRELNRLTTILLDIFEDQLDLGRLVVMEDARRLLDQQLRQLGRAVLQGGGSVSAATAREAAHAAYADFDRRRREQRHAAADAAIAAIRKEARKIKPGS